MERREYKRGRRGSRGKSDIPASARVDVAALGQRDLAVVAGAGCGGAVGHLGAGELVLNR